MLWTHTTHTMRTIFPYSFLMQYEADWERNLRQILETQYDLNRAVKYVHSNIVVDVLLFTCFPYRLLQDKTEQVISTILTASPSPGGGALPAGMREELTSIKNTQSLVQHQLGDLRYGSTLCNVQK